MALYRLGRYEIIEEIGSGGFATVFRGQDKVLEREVAVKVMRPLLMSDSTFVARFQHEARIAAQLEHPNIIPIYDYGEVEGRLFLVMKLVRSGSLETRLAHGPIFFAETVAIFQQIVAGLAYAHEKKMVHRDLKPDNILIDERGHVYIADLGLVKALESSSLTTTMSGGVLGTPAYVAPEVWEGQPASSAADIYALGCLLYEMVMGQALFVGDTGPAVMLAHFRPPNLPEEWPPGVPDGLTQLLQKALARLPEERHDSATALIEQLQQIAAPPKELTAVPPPDPLDKPYAALQQAINQQEWETALQLVETIKAQNPTYMEIEKLAETVVTSQQAAQKAVWAFQWQQQAEAALASGNSQGARAAIQRWREIAPDDPEITRFLDHLQVEDKRQAAINALQQEAERALANEQWETAREKAIQWIILDTTSAAPQEIIAKAIMKQQKEEDKKTIEPGLSKPVLKKEPLPTNETISAKPVGKIHRCPSCNREIRANARFCPQCHKEIPERNRLLSNDETPLNFKKNSHRCPSCGFTVSSKSVFCPACSLKLLREKRNKK